MTNLFDFTSDERANLAPRARNADRETSHRAARFHTGKAMTNAQIVLRAVWGWPKSTRVELAPRTQPRLDDIEVQRRLSDLATAGLVEVVGTRKLPGHRSAMSTYAVTDRGRELVLEALR